MNEQKILVLVRRLRDWCYEISESGPIWSKKHALNLIERCDRFSSRLNENLLFLSDYYGMTWTQACEELHEALFNGHETFDLNCGNGFLHRDPDCVSVRWLCLKLDRRAPEGWHGRLGKMDKRYREMFHGKF